MSQLTGETDQGHADRRLRAGFWHGVKEGVVYARTGWSERDSIAEKLDYTRVIFKHPWIQAYVDWTFRILGAGDHPFYYGTMMASLSNQAVTQAMNEGATGAGLKQRAQQILDEPSESMIETAVEDAANAVFANRTDWAISRP